MEILYIGHTVNQRNKSHSMVKIFLTILDNKVSFCSIKELQYVKITQTISKISLYKTYYLVQKISLQFSNIT